MTVSSSLNVSLFVGVATARRGAICTWIGCINKQEPPLPEPINRRGSRGKPGSFTCCVKCPLTGMERWLSTNTPSGAFPPMAASGALYFTHAGLRSSFPLPGSDDANQSHVHALVFSRFIVFKAINLISWLGLFPNRKNTIYLISIVL